MTRKIIAIFAALLLSLSFVACSEQQETTEETTATKIEITTDATTAETTEEETETEQTPAADLEFDAVNNESVYVLHKNKAVVLHNAPSYTDGATLSVANGTKLTRTGISANGEWSKVVYQDKTYYVASQAITTLADLDAGFTAVDKTYGVVANVNVRLAPVVTELNGEVTQYNVIGSLANGDTIKVLAVNTAENWLKIEFASEFGTVGYVRYNDAWFTGDEAETTEATTAEVTEAETEAATEAETETETAAPAGK